jgi:glutamine synthetase
VPRTLRMARDAFTSSTVAREVLGDEVVDHYTNMADVELEAFDAAVTDWELRRGFERM